MTLVHDDALFDAVFRAAAESERAPMTGLELYERRGALVEVTEDEAGLATAVVEERGFALRLFRAGRVAFAAAGPSEAVHLADRARTLLPRARPRRGFRPPSPQPGEETTRTPLQSPLPESPEIATDVIHRLRQILASASKGAVSLTGATVLSGERRERIETTSGRAAAWNTAAATLTATVVGKSGGERYSSRILGAAPTMAEIPVARLAHLAIDRVLLPLSGKPCPEGRYDLVIDPLVAGHLIGRLAPLFFGDGEGELLRTWTKDGKEPFASSVISLVDSGEAPGGTVRVVRDAEGTPKRRTVVVDRGQLVGALTDVAAAARLEAPPTGNSIRLTWSAEPEIGAANFHVDPSPGISPIDILKGVSRGVYAAVLLEKPDIDPAEDRFRIACCGYSIEKGRPSGKLSEIILAGRLTVLLRSIQAIGDDPKFVSIPGGGAGSPTLFIPKWRFL